MAKPDTKYSELVVIKKYANRRLYDTSISKYVTLEDLCDMIKRGEDFIVHDAKSGDDLTRSVLTQIIFEQESKGYNLLPENFLKHVIKFYDTGMGNVLPAYLEKTMDNFTANQEEFRSMMGSYSGFDPMKQFEEMGRKNIEFFEKTMGIFSPFGPSSSKSDKDDD